MSQITKNEVYELIAKALADKLPDNGNVEIEQDNYKLFVRFHGQVFAIAVEEKEQFNRVADAETAAKNFMITLPTLSKATAVSDTIRNGDVVRTKSIRSPAMLVVECRLQPDERVFAELLWFDANMNARQINVDTDLLEHVPEQ